MSKLKTKSQLISEMDLPTEEPLEYSDEFVYPLIRIDQFQSPLSIYIPKKEIMFKIMRASIEVDTEGEFWFNQ